MMTGGSIVKYYVNMRLVHGFLSSGLTETQYTSACEAACIGAVGEKTFDSDYNIDEVAHDFVVSLKKWFEEQHIVNFFDSWHAKATRTHVYFAMKNNGGTAGNFREYILNVINHYQAGILIDIYGDLDIDSTPKVYRMTRVTFGVIASPFLAVCTTQEHARKHKESFPQASDEILKNTYVDDLATGMPALNDPLDFDLDESDIQEIDEICRSYFSQEEDEEVNVIDLEEQDEMLPKVKSFTRIQCTRLWQALHDKAKKKRDGPVKFDFKGTCDITDHAQDTPQLIPHWRAGFEFHGRQYYTVTTGSTTGTGTGCRTTKTKVQNDILRSVDDKGCVLLLMLDLSAAFDTVNHNILLNRLHNRYGIADKAFSWFHSYLNGNFSGL
ncbi:hypothetical protein QZH41_006729 [Actinostola sp. cb2023]|nr:hypothetical protein QZH41_006729 [Actinostola sp. cb2023]